MCRVFALEYLLRAYSHNTSKKINVRKENLGTIEGNSCIISLEDMEINMANKHDTCPNNNTATSKQVTFNVFGEVVLCFTITPYVYTSIIANQIKAALICKEHSRSLQICTVLCSWHRRKRRLR